MEYYTKAHHKTPSPVAYPPHSPGDAQHRCGTGVTKGAGRTAPHPLCNGPGALAALPGLGLPPVKRMQNACDAEQHDDVGEGEGHHQHVLVPQTGLGPPHVGPRLLLQWAPSVPAEQIGRCMAV